MSIPNGLKLRHIEGFLAVAQDGTISGAARKLNMTQPALSKTIGELELRLGSVLFDRVGRKTVLTAAGETFQRHAMSAMNSIEAGVRSLGGEDRRHTVSVGILPTVAGEFFPSVALEFSRQRPEAQIRVLTGPNKYLLERLRAGEIDLMVGRMPTAADLAGLKFEFLYEDPIWLVARAGHPMADADPADAVRKSPLILPNKGAIIREAVDAYLNVIGLDDVQPAFESVTLSFARALLLNSDMMWFISRGVVRQEVRSGSLMTFPVKSAFMSGALGMTTKPTAEANGMVAHLAELLRKFGACED